MEYREIKWLNDYYFRIIFQGRLFMDEVPLITLILYSFPESVLIFVYSLRLINKKINWSLVFLASALSVTASYFIRLLPLPYGIHTLLGVLIILVILISLFNLDVKQAFFLSLISMCTLVALENIVLRLVQLYYNLTIRDILELTPITRAMIGYPHLLIWLIIIELIKKKQIYIFRARV